MRFKNFGNSIFYAFRKEQRRGVRESAMEFMSRTMIENQEHFLELT